MIFSSFLLFLSLFFVVVVLLYKSSPQQKHGTLPPSPPGLPIVGNYLQIGSLAHRSLRALSERYGHIMLLKFGSIPTVVISSAEAAEEVMKTHDLSFASRPPSLMGDILLYGSTNISFSPYGEYWRQARKVSVLHLLTAKQVHLFFNITTEEVSSMVHQIRSAAGGRVNISELLVTLTNDIACRVVLGKKYTNQREGRNKNGELLAELLNLLGKFPIGDYIPWLSWVDNVSGLLGRARKTALEMDGFLEQVLDEHIQTHEPGSDARDFVDILLSFDNESSMGVSLTRDNIKAILLDMLAGGTHTAYSSLEWAMAELTRRPTILKKVQEDVRKSVGTNACMTEEDIGKMIYFKAAIKETLRLHPPIPMLVPREAIKSSKLCNYEIPAKTRVIINAWAIGRDPKYWERAEEFIPDRFLSSPIDFKGLNFQFIPFGAGRRRCPGITYAVPIIQLALAKLLYHFNWEMPDDLKGEEMDMREVAGLALQKKTNLLLVATPTW